MLDGIFDFLDRFEFGFNSICWNWAPSFFKYDGVAFKGKFAEEYGFFWLNIRASIYANAVTYKELLDRRANAKEDN